MKRLISTLLAAVMTLSAVATPSLAVAQSYTGPWAWTDISSQLTTRTNRPVWAVAYAGGNWFYTDGLDLWNTGQVYRYDPSTSLGTGSQTNITLEVRNAGLNRVDDIVSDGQTVLFLQDVVRLDSQLRAVAYRNGQYQNVTNALRNALSSNEGVSSVNGRNGTWMVVTTQGRLFRWDGTSSSPSLISLPSPVANNIEGTIIGLRYNVNHGSANVGTWRLPLAMVPVQNNQWMLIADAVNNPVRFYRYDGSSFSDITSQFPTTDQVAKITSNGETAFISALGPNGSWTRLANGNGTAEIQMPTSVFYDFYGLGRADEIRAYWNGKSWFILQGKQLYRVNGSFVTQTAESYGQVADLFLQGAGDNNGRLLLGGALSQTWTNDPTLPITAKLVMVTEGVATPQVLGLTFDDFGGTPANGVHTYTSTFGPRMTTEGIPNGFRVANGGTFTYRVTAEDSAGVDRVEIYVNDARIKTCYSTVCEFSNMYWAQGSNARSVKFWARATDRTGYLTENSGSPEWLTVEGTSSTFYPTYPTGQVQGVSDTSGSNWTWLEPNQTTLYRDQNVAFYAGANDADGIQRIEIYVNGSVRQTCSLGNATGNQTCGTRLYANDYSQGTSVFVNAKVTDGRGVQTWTGGTTLTRANDGSGSGNNGNNANPSVWTSYSPSDTTLYRDQNKTFTATAWDGDGLRRIEIFVNGSVKRTCDFGTAYGNQNCVATIYANDYTNGTNVAVNARVTDAYGNVSWSDITTFFRANDGGTVLGASDSAGSNWVWFEPNRTEMYANQNVAFYVGAWDGDGINRIEILVNGNVRQTCNLGNATGDQTCATRLFANDYAQGTSLFVNAKITDGRGNVSWTSSKSLFRGLDSGHIQDPGNVANPSVWTSFSPSDTTLRANQSITFTANAWDEQGIRSIEIFVNGSSKWVCNPVAAPGNQRCDMTLFANDYAPGTNLAVKARATGAFGGTTWSETTTFFRANDNQASGGSERNPSAWEWLEPDRTSIPWDGNKVWIDYHVGAWDENGIRSIRIVVNGKTWRTCEFNPGFGNQECRTQLFTYNFDPDTDVFVNAVAKDAFGNETWTSGKTFHVN